jgi:hypothetical protein
MGTCGAVCLGSTLCGSSCVETQNDPANCGACNNVCPAGQVCSMGTCGVDCLGGSTLCGSSCVETQTDPNHCGGCNTVCPAGETCSGGTCGNCSSIDLALLAAPSASAGGSVAPFLPVELNNGYGESQCGDYSWVQNSNVAGADAWFELDWPSAVTIASMYIESPLAGGGPCGVVAGRNVASANVQTWNGSAWVTATSIAGGSGSLQVNLPSPISTTKLRLDSVLTSPGNGNSIIWEWHVFGTPSCVPPAD